jgi:thiamine pyrophosphate-dependent acetolactate synthase large subunit-like protein
MAVSLSAPGRAVVASSGDGGFNMNLGGLETARQAGCGLNPRNT